MKNEAKNREDDSLDTPVSKYDLLLEKMNSISTSLEERMNSTSIQLEEKINSMSIQLEEKINSMSTSIKTIYWVMGIHFAITIAGFTFLISRI